MIRPKLYTTVPERATTPQNARRISFSQITAQGRENDRRVTLFLILSLPPLFHSMVYLAHNRSIPLPPQPNLFLTTIRPISGFGLGKFRSDLNAFAPLEKRRQ